MTALHIAAENGLADIVELLLKSEARVSKLTFCLKSPLSKQCLAFGLYFYLIFSFELWMQHL